MGVCSSCSANAAVDTGKPVGAQPVVPVEEGPSRNTRPPLSPVSGSAFAHAWPAETSNTRAVRAATPIHERQVQLHEPGQDGRQNTQSLHVQTNGPGEEDRPHETSANSRSGIKTTIVDGSNGNTSDWDGQPRARAESLDRKSSNIDPSDEDLRDLSTMEVAWFLGRGHPHARGGTSVVPLDDATDSELIGRTFEMLARGSRYEEMHLAILDIHRNYGLTPANVVDLRAAFCSLVGSEAGLLSMDDVRSIFSYDTADSTDANANTSANTTTLQDDTDSRDADATVGSATGGAKSKSKRLGRKKDTPKTNRLAKGKGTPQASPSRRRNNSTSASSSSSSRAAKGSESALKRQVDSFIHLLMDVHGIPQETTHFSFDEFVDLVASFCIMDQEQMTAFVFSAFDENRERFSSGADVDVGFAAGIASAGSGPGPIQDSVNRGFLTTQTLELFVTMIQSYPNLQPDMARATRDLLNDPIVSMAKTTYVYKPVTGASAGITPNSAGSVSSATTMPEQLDVRIVEAEEQAVAPRAEREAQRVASGDGKRKLKTRRVRSHNSGKQGAKVTPASTVVKSVSSGALNRKAVVSGNTVTRRRRKLRGKKASGSVSASQMPRSKTDSSVWPKPAASVAPGDRGADSLDGSDDDNNRASRDTLVLPDAAQLREDSSTDYDSGHNKINVIGRLNYEAFVALRRKYPCILFPAFRLQLEMQASFLSRPVWDGLQITPRPSLRPVRSIDSLDYDNMVPGVPTPPVLSRHPSGSPALRRPPGIAIDRRGSQSSGYSRSNNSVVGIDTGSHDEVPGDYFMGVSAATPPTHPSTKRKGITPILTVQVSRSTKQGLLDDQASPASAPSRPATSSLLLRRARRGGRLGGLHVRSNSSSTTLGISTVGAGMSPKSMHGLGSYASAGTSSGPGTAAAAATAAAAVHAALGGGVDSAGVRSGGSRPSSRRNQSTTIDYGALVSNRPRSFTTMSTVPLSYSSDERRPPLAFGAGDESSPALTNPSPLRSVGRRSPAALRLAERRPPTVSPPVPPLTVLPPAASLAASLAAPQAPSAGGNKTPLRSQHLRHRSMDTLALASQLAAAGNAPASEPAKDPVTLISPISGDGNMFISPENSLRAPKLRRPSTDRSLNSLNFLFPPSNSGVTTSSSSERSRGGKEKRKSNDTDPGDEPSLTLSSLDSAVDTEHTDETEEDDRLASGRLSSRIERELGALTDRSNSGSSKRRRSRSRSRSRNARAGKDKFGMHYGASGGASSVLAPAVKQPIPRRGSGRSSLSASSGRSDSRSHSYEDGLDNSANRSLSHSLLLSRRSHSESPRRTHRTERSAFTARSGMSVDIDDTGMGQQAPDRHVLSRAVRTYGQSVGSESGQKRSGSGDREISSSRSLSRSIAQHDVEDTEEEEDIASDGRSPSEERKTDTLYAKTKAFLPATQSSELDEHSISERISGSYESLTHVTDSTDVEDLDDALLSGAPFDSLMNSTNIMHVINGGLIAESGPVTDTDVVDADADPRLKAEVESNRLELQRQGNMSHSPITTSLAVTLPIRTATAPALRPAVMDMDPCLSPGSTAVSYQHSGYRMRKLDANRPASLRTVPQPPSAPAGPRPSFHRSRSDIGAVTDGYRPHSGGTLQHYNTLPALNSASSSAMEEVKSAAVSRASRTNRVSAAAPPPDSEISYDFFYVEEREREIDQDVAAHTQQVSSLELLRNRQRTIESQAIRSRRSNGWTSSAAAAPAATAADSGSSPKQPREALRPINSDQLSSSPAHGVSPGESPATAASPAPRPPRGTSSARWNSAGGFGGLRVVLGGGKPAREVFGMSGDTPPERHRVKSNRRRTFDTMPHEFTSAVAQDRTRKMERAASEAQERDAGNGTRLSGAYLTAGKADEERRKTALSYDEAVRRLPERSATDLSYVTGRRMAEPPQSRWSSHRQGSFGRSGHVTPPTHASDDSPLSSPVQPSPSPPPSP